MKEQGKDRLKDFVQENREEFDFHSPPKMDFGSIAKKEEPKSIKMIPIAYLYRVAAVFIAIFGLTVFWMINSNNTEQSETAEVQIQSNHKEFSLGELSPEMAELEEYYSNELSSKQKILDELGYGDAITDELELLDAEFLALKNELGENVDNHLIVNEMVKNYKLKLDLLESVLMDLQEEYDDKSLTNLQEDESYTVYY